MQLEFLRLIYLKGFSRNSVLKSQNVHKPTFYSTSKVRIFVGMKSWMGKFYFQNTFHDVFQDNNFSYFKMCYCTFTTNYLNYEKSLILEFAKSIKFDTKT